MWRTAEDGWVPLKSCEVWSSWDRLFTKGFCGGAGVSGSGEAASG